jgi:formiminotetrahydrofolate cyclodeaminase
LCGGATKDGTLDDTHDANDTAPTELTLRGLAERLAASDPVPGGGSAAAAAGALGAALVHMVVELSVTRPELAEHRDELREIGLASAGWQSELLNLADLDANAYAAVVRARRLPRGTQREKEMRRAQIGAATREATRTPLHIAELGAEVLALAERLAPLANRNAVSDVGVGALLASAAVTGGMLNVRINLPNLDDADLRAEAESKVGRLDDEARRRLASVLAELDRQLAAAASR